MSISGMQEAWGSFEGHARSFRESARESLLAGEALEEQSEELVSVLDALVESSENLRRQGDSALREGEEYEYVSTLILATAAVDAMLARDLAVLDPEIDLARLEEWLSGRGGERTILEEDAEPDRVFKEGERLLEEVGQLFSGQPPPNAGRSPNHDRATLASEATTAIERLENLATPPARDLAGGLVGVAFAGVGGFLSAAVHIDVVTEIERAGNTLNKHAPRLLREHVAKVATLRSDSRILDEMAKEVGERVDARVDAAGVVGSLLRSVYGSQKAVAHVRQRIDNAPELTDQQADALLADLTALHSKYSGQMHWLGKSALWLRRGARLMVHLGALAVGALSYAIGGGVFFVGFGYVGYSLTDRIDARNLGFADRVDGVIRLVDRHIPLSSTSPSS
jgi:hypothetical protein